MSLPPLYPHQERSIEQLRLAFLEGVRRAVLVLPPGAGKTRTGTEFFARALRKGRRVLWLCHRVELLDQAAASLSKLDTPFGIIKADRVANPNAPLQIASVQTLHARPQSFPDHVDIIASDECHHDKAQTREAIFGRYPELEFLLGLTATPERGDGKPLGVSSGGVYQKLIVGATVAELQRTPRDMRDPNGPKILVPFRVAGPEKPQRELFRAPIEGYLEFGRRADGRLRPALFFAQGVKASREIERDGLARGVRIKHVDGSTDGDEREQAFEDLRNGRLDAITNDSIATEGTDIPNLEVVAVCRGVSAASTWIQMVMRAGRSCPATGKTEALLIDYRGWSHVHGLMEEDREFSLDGKAIVRKERSKLRKCQSCGALVAPKPTCSSCGHVHVVEVQEQGVRRSKAVTITRDMLTPQHVKKAFYDSLVEECTRKGFKLGWIGYAFEKRFGYWPPWLAGLIRMRARGGRAA